MHASDAADTAAPLLLLQIRAPWHDAALEQEQLCFRELGGVDAEQMRCVNLVEWPHLRWEDAAAHQVLLIGGAGSHSVTHEYAFTRPLARVVERWLEEGRPLFGSCWGHQFLVWLLGGRVVTDLAREEVGSFGIHLTAAGRGDPLFAGFPATFTAHLGHHDVVTGLPAGMVELAYSDACPNQAIRLHDLPVYGTQFHAEMSRRRMRERLKMYSAEYLPAADLDAELDRILRPSPEAETLMARFLRRYAPDVITSDVEIQPARLPAS